MSRADEIAQGLREPGGALTFPLDAEEYGQGFADFNEGKPPPRLTSPSYDLGRALGQRRREDAERAASLLAKIEEDRRQAIERVREMLKDRPDVLAQYDADMAAIAPTPSPLPPASDSVDSRELRQ